MNRSAYQELNGKINFQFRPGWFFLYCVEDILLWSLFFILLQQDSAVMFLASVPFSLLMFRNFTFMHESVHGVAHPNKKANYILGLFSGAISFLPYELWKSIHVDHHYWTGNFDKDPALEVVKQYPNSSKAMKFIFTIMWRTRFPLMSFFQYIVFWGHSLVRLIKKPNNLKAWLSFITPCAVWTLFLLSMSPSQIAVVGLGIFLYSLLFDFINLPHHVGVYTYDPQAKTPIWNQHMVSRTCRYPALLEHLVMNFNFHAEHHMYPTLPWHELKKVHSLLDGHKSSSDFHVIRAGWLAKQRKKTFAEFLRPDLNKDLINDKKSA